MFFKKKIILLSILILVSFFYIYNKNDDKKIYFPIKTISIESKIVNSNKMDIFKISKEYLSSKSFFNFKIDTLKEEIEKIEWIRSANIRRSYPSEVKIFVEEHMPIVIWNEKSYLNKFGEIFFIKEINKDLPRLQSSDDRNLIMFNYFSLFSKNLSNNGISDKIERIEENEIRSLSVFLSSGIIIRFGSKDVKDKLIMFFKVYKTLNTRDLNRIRYIDMRYSNGFSIGWK